MVSGNGIMPVGHLNNVQKMPCTFITLKIDILTPSLDFKFHYSSTFIQFALGVYSLLFNFIEITVKCVNVQFLNYFLFNLMLHYSIVI